MWTFAVEDLHWLTRVSGVMVLVGQVPLAVASISYAEITEGSIWTFAFADERSGGLTSKKSRSATPTAVHRGSR